MTPKRMSTLAAILGAASVICFLVGVALLGAAFAISARAGGGADDGGGGGGFFGGGDGPVKAQWESGTPEGLYLMTRFNSFSGSLAVHSYYFTDDGRVYEDLEDGFADEQLATHKGRHGTVKVEGDSMTLTWSDGDAEKSDVERSETGFAWNVATFTPVKPFEDRAELVGQWEGGHSSSYGGSTAVTSRTFDLKEDGTFSGGSAGSIVSESDESVVTGGGAGKHAGKWELDGYALVLTFDGGTVRRGIAFPYDDSSTPVKPDRFFFGGTMYRKQS